jgi:hypothetical protein
MNGLSPFAPTTYPDLVAYLKREKAMEDADPDRIVRAGNRAVSWMEMRTARALVARTWREPVTIACGLTVDLPTATGTGFTASVKAYDEVVGDVALALGSRVLSVESNTSLTLTEKAVATDATVSLTFGSEPLVVSGDGSEEIYVPEFPVHEVYGAWAREADGTLVALDISGARLDKSSGRYVLTNDFFPSGTLNIVIECLAGYRAPSVTSRGDWSAYMELQGICHRAAQVFFKDEKDSPGRLVSQTVAQMGGSLPNFRMPEDIDSAIEAFARRG